ncbi:MAG: CBS domain-containing protein [Archaeoglobi archaeon]|nr:CBS domain-containing protein [Candidatus Mnemosynella bozhongmuii]
MKRYFPGEKKLDPSSTAPLDRGPVEFKSRISEHPGDVMKIATRNVVSVPPTTTIMGAAKTMTKYGFRRLPVVDAGSRRLMGIVSTMDIIDFFGGGNRYNLVKNKYGGNLLAAINEEVREIMEENVITITEYYSIKEALKTLRERNVGALPIVNDENQLIGIVTEKDFVFMASEVESFDIFVYECMTRDVRSVRPSVKIRDASKEMIQRGFRRLPVVEDGILVGILTASDIVRYLSTGEAFSKLVTGNIDEALNVPVSEIMSKEVVFISSDVDIAEAARVMMKHDIGALPVIDGDELVGIITERDFIKAMRV